MIFFRLGQAVDDCPPILRVLDAKRQIVGTDRSRKDNLQHPYAPKYAIFHEKTANNGRCLVNSLDFWALSYFQGAGCENQIVGTHRSRKHNLQHPYAPKYAIFRQNRPKKWRFFVKY